MLEGNKGFVAICILSCVILGFSSFADAAQFTLKLGHGAAPDNPRHLVALDFAKDVEQKTGGAVTIKVFPILSKRVFKVFQSSLKGCFLRSRKLLYLNLYLK